MSALAGLRPAPAGDAALPRRRHWHIAGASVRGAAHRRTNTPNQDALRWSASPIGTIFALSDGHGSARCFRSDIGARLAVAAATRILTQSLTHDLTNLQTIESLTQTIVHEWSIAVRCDQRLFPLTPTEERLADPHHPLLPYGATLCAVAITDTSILYLQLGDGDIVTVSPTGAVHRPLPDDDRLIANQTTSLCSPKAAHEFRVGLQTLDHLDPHADEPPALVLLSTDGYANSFRSERGFLRAAPDLLDMIRTEGIEPVRQCLPAWLEEASRLGSGDDVTVGLLVRDTT